MSALGALLTLLTAAAVLSLVARPPPLATAPPSPPSAPSRGEETAPPAVEPGGDDRARDDEVGAFVPRLLALAASPELGWLRGLAGQLRPQGFALADARFTVSDTPLGESATIVLDAVRLRPDADGWRAAVRGRVAGTPAVAFDGTARLTGAAGREERLTLTLARLDAGALARRLAPELVREAEATASAVVETELAGGTLAGDVAATVRLGAPARLRLRGMAEALPVTMLEAALRRDDRGVVIERAALASPAFRLAGHGRVGADGVRLTLAADDVDVTWAPRVWPAGVAEGARDWIGENVTAGRISRLAARVDLDAAALAGDVLPADAVYGEARVDDAEIHYLRPMPPAVGADATARFDGERLTFAIARGRSSGVEITGGEVVIRDYGDPSTVERLDVALDGRGAVPAMLALTDHEPLTLASRKGLPLAGSAGSGTFRLELALPLLEDLELESVDLAFEGEFSDVTLPAMAAGHDLTEAEFTLAASVDAVRASGRGRIDGVPLALTFRTEGEREILNARGDLDATRLAALGAPALPLTGTVGLDATLTTAGRTERSELDLDVTAAEVEVPQLAVWKPRGVAGTIEARIVETPTSTTVERLAVNWPGAEIEGSAQLDGEGRLSALRLDPLRLAGTDLRIEGERDGGTLAVRIEGPRLDLAPLTAGGDGGAGDGPAPDLAAQAPLTLDLAVGEVVAGGDGSLADLAGRLRADRDGLAALRLDAAVRPGDGTVQLRLEPADGAERLTFLTDDAGGVASALAVSGALRGGALEITATVTRRRPQLRLEGEIAARDFVMSGVPPVVRVLAAAPQTEDLADDDLAVARFNSPVTLDGRVLTFEDALLVASNLAVRASGDVDLAAERLDLQGSLAPAQGLNRFIGNLPLIGALLQGSRKAGAFALSFTVRGAWRDPTVNVNPLSVVTPGLLQDLFAGAEVRPPRLPPNDD